MRGIGGVPTGGRKPADRARSKARLAVMTNEGETVIQEDSICKSTHCGFFLELVSV
jgi:hypothetical protein